MESVTVELHAVTAEIRSLVDMLASQERGTVQTVIHKSDGSSFMVGMCAACVVIMIAFIVIENRSFSTIGRSIAENKSEVQNDLRDVKAWNEVLRGKVAKLEAQQQPEKPK